MQESLELSIIIVSYNVREFLEQALLSIHRAVKNISHEVFVVDNASSDGSADLIARKFPSAKLIRNSTNLGFARANNMAVGQCRGEFICLINPDTIVQEDTFSVLLAFLRNHPQAGAAGCKILNPDGTLLAAGDLLVAGSLQDWLADRGTRLRWDVGFEHGSEPMDADQSG